MTPSPTLRSERLTLRPIRTDDAPAVQQYRGDPDVVRYLTQGRCDLDQTRDRLAEAAERWRRR